MSGASTPNHIKKINQNTIDILATSNKALSAINNTPKGRLNIIDMHYGASLGLGFLSTETGSERHYVVAVAASKGDLTLTLTANASVQFAQALVQNQLICYLSSNGQYYPAAIGSIVGAVLTLNSPLEAPIATGENVFNWWTNESHPTANGFKCITDYALRNLKYSGVEVARPKLGVFGSPSVNTNGANNVNSPGSLGVVNKNVIINTAATDGVSFTFTPRSTGAYMARFKVNTFGKNVKISWSASGYSDSITVNHNQPAIVEFPFFVFSDVVSHTILMMCEFDGDAFLVNEQAEIIKVDGAKPNINGGKHVLLGDSWAGMMGAVGSGDFYFESKLPDAEWVNSGVGGNKSVDLIGRWIVDVEVHEPDFVWVMVGTNDYYGGVSSELFSYYINKLKALCASIGAHCIIFNSSVASAQLSTERFDLSRQYAQSLAYYDREINSKVSKKMVISIPSTTIPAGQTVNLAELGRFAGTEVIIYESCVSQVCTVGEATSITNGAATIGTITGFVTSDVVLTGSGGRFIRIDCNNSTGLDFEVKGYLVVEDGSSS